MALQQNILDTVSIVLSVDYFGLVDTFRLDYDNTDH